jgi:hypothetical protein
VVTPPPRRKPEKAAKAFYTRRLKRILINPAIAGLRAYHGEIVSNATWPPILDHATWAAAGPSCSPQSVRPADALTAGR